VKWWRLWRGRRYHLVPLESMPFGPALCGARPKQTAKRTRWDQRYWSHCPPPVGNGQRCMRCWERSGLTEESEASP
jgi:hypothetical protein